MISIIKILGGVRATLFAGAAVAALAFAGFQSYKLNSAESELATQKAALAITAKEYAEYKLEQAKKLQQKLADATTEHLREKANAEQKYESIIDSLRSGNLQLRQRFTCPATSGQLPSPASPGSDGGTESGLLREDAEFLIGEAQRADEIVRQLKLAQETIRIMLERDAK